MIMTMASDQVFRRRVAYQCHNVGVPGIFSDLVRSVQMLKIEWSAESNGKLPHLFSSSKTATLVSELAVEELPLDRTATLIPVFAMKDLPLGRTLMMMMMMIFALFSSLKFWGVITQTIPPSCSGLGYLNLWENWLN